MSKMTDLLKEISALHRDGKIQLPPETQAKVKGMLKEMLPKEQKIEKTWMQKLPFWKQWGHWWSYVVLDMHRRLHEHCALSGCTPRDKPLPFPWEQV